jgi:hypothetical protein
MCEDRLFRLLFLDCGSDESKEGKKRQYDDANMAALLFFSKPGVAPVWNR